MALLKYARWPGNVRQLENAVFRAVVLAEGDEIGPQEFPQIAAREAAEPSTPAPLVPDDGETSPAAEQPLLIEPAPAFALDRMSLLDGAGQMRPLDELEAEIIRFAIAHYRGQMSEVARRLKIGRSTLYRKLDALQPAQGGHQDTTDPVAAE
jgi:DNA-binding NtrC family response regulator